MKHNQKFGKQGNIIKKYEKHTKKQNDRKQKWAKQDAKKAEKKKS